MSALDYTVGFWKVAQASDSKSFIQFLDDLAQLDSIKDCKRQIHTLLTPQKGRHILEVGCGIGDDVMTLARLVGSEGRVIGVDNNPIMIEEAKRRSAGKFLPVEWRLEDARSLNFADDTFDACVAERIFVHIDGPHKLLAEMIRVVRPGGQVLIFDIDADSLVFNITDRVLNRKVIHAICDGLRNGWIGRQLPAMIRNSCLADVIIIPQTLIFPLKMLRATLGGALKSAQEAFVLTEREVSTWWDKLEEAEQQSEFFCAVQGFLVGGKIALSHQSGVQITERPDSCATT